MFEDSYTQVIEETINGFDIYIEPNPDQYRGGFLTRFFPSIIFKSDFSLKSTAHTAISYR